MKLRENRHNEVTKEKKLREARARPLVCLARTVAIVNVLHASRGVTARACGEAVGIETFAEAQFKAATQYHCCCYIDCHLCS